MAKKTNALNLFGQAAWEGVDTARKAQHRDDNAGVSEIMTLWKQCLEIIKDNLSVQVFRTWFEPIKALSFEEGEVTLQVPSQFYYEWLEEHYNTLLQKSVYQVFGTDTTLKYQVVIDSKKESLEQRTITLPGFRHSGVSAIQTKLPFVPASSSVEHFSSYLNPRYTFDNFIIGDSNQLACSAANAVAENSGRTRFNPLVLYSGNGLGKTHLVQAIGNRILKKNKRARVIYTTSERFTMEFVSAIQNNSHSAFSAFYRSMDVLIVDDIQFFANKEKTQDNFFHTFNALHQAGKQLIFGSDIPPKELKDIDERLISRFQWGLTADIQPPDLEMRMAIVQRKSKDEGITLPFYVVEYIAKQVTSNVREIEGCLISLIAKVSFDKRSITLDLVKEVVQSVVREVARKPLSVDEIKAEVSSHFNVSLDLLAGKTRKHEIVLARQAAMYFAKQLTTLSLKSIGSNFGGKDHSTVLHSINTIENYLVTDQTVSQSLELLRKNLTRKR